jgi:hypothetical protein
MHTRLTRITAVISALIVLRILLHTAVNPMDDVRADLARELAQVPASGASGGEGLEFAALQNRIAGRPSLWRELIAAPEAPPEAPAVNAGPSAPNLADRLKDVSMGRGQIGTNKIRVHTPDAPEGQWMSIGTAINGCTLDSFTRDEAIFTYDWKEGGKKLSIALPRP